MCQLGFDGRCDFWNQTHPVAKKPHRCVCCYSTIAPGERYLRETGKWEGDVFSDACCLHCETSRDEFAEAHGNSFPFAGSFVEFLQGCLEGGGDAEDDRRWASALRHIERRQKAAA